MKSNKKQNTERIDDDEYISRIGKRAVIAEVWHNNSIKGFNVRLIQQFGPFVSGTSWPFTDQKEAIAKFGELEGEYKEAGWNQMRIPF